MPDTFRALIAEGDSKQYSVDFKDIPHGSLHEGEVLIQAMYSSLNYKDGLAITRRGKVIRKFPMVLGDEDVDLGCHLGREGGGATGSQVRMSVHALEERGEHAPGLIYHEHHIMEKLQAPREDAGPDRRGVPDTHFGGIPEVMLIFPPVLNLISVAVKEFSPIFHRTSCGLPCSVLQNL